MTEPLVLEGGHYDIARRNDLRSELARTRPHSDVPLDLVRTDTIDCSCLGVLIAQLLKWKEDGADTKFRLYNVAPSIAHMLTLLELDALFKVESLRSNDS
jgi:anti-anti-sigma regulatory factor